MLPFKKISLQQKVIPLSCFRETPLRSLDIFTDTEGIDKLSKAVEQLSFSFSKKERKEKKEKHAVDDQSEPKSLFIEQEEEIKATAISKKGDEKLAIEKK